MRIKWKVILVHLLLWMLYIIIWGFRDMIYAPTFWDTVGGNVIGSLCYSIGVYLNLYVLVPFFLLKKRRVAYAILLALLIVFISFLCAQTFVFYYLSQHIPTAEFFASLQGIGNTGSDFLVILGFSMCFYFINEWYIKERRLRELESANLRAELDLLKGQINPHFLFNALNSVHVLIRKNPEKALDTLEIFSDLLSHQIYDVEKELVPLETEVKNLSNFIALQELRFSSHVNVNWQVTGELTGLKIAPMLFLNFVENAFKHGGAKEGQDVTIDILMTVEKGWLTFSCVNSKSEKSGGSDNSGKGLLNVKRRIELLYPKRHTLEIERKANEFSINLQIKLNED